MTDNNKKETFTNESNEKEKNKWTVTDEEMKEAYEFDLKMAERTKDLREGKISQEEYDKQFKEFLEEGIPEDVLKKVYEL